MKGYNVYELEGDHLKFKGFTTENQFELKKTGFLNFLFPTAYAAESEINYYVSSVDKFSLESAPVSQDYDGYEKPEQPEQPVEQRYIYQNINKNITKTNLDDAIKSQTFNPNDYAGISVDGFTTNQYKGVLPQENGIALISENNENTTNSYNYEKYNTKTTTTYPEKNEGKITTAIPTTNFISLPNHSKLNSSPNFTISGTYYYHSYASSVHYFCNSIGGYTCSSLTNKEDYYFTGTSYNLICTTASVSSCFRSTALTSGPYTYLAKRSGNNFVGTMYSTTTVVTDTKDTFVGTLIAPLNTYANNAKASDGYWYLLKDAVKDKVLLNLDKDNKLISQYNPNTKTITSGIVNFSDYKENAYIKIPELNASDIEVSLQTASGWTKLDSSQINSTSAVSVKDVIGWKIVFKNDTDFLNFNQLIVTTKP